MRATKFEFRFRFFVFALIYGLGFALHLNKESLTLGECLAILTGHSTRATIQVFFALGAVVVAIGAMIRTWATAYLKGEVVHDMAMHSDRLVADGPYRYVRNPLYLGTILLSAGIGFLATVPGYVFLVGATLLFTMRLILREEAGLQATQAQNFLSFKASVPRLLPALNARIPGSGRRPQWRQAWLAESFMWAFSAALLLFAITLDARALLVMMLGTLLTYAVLHVLNSHRQKQTAAGSR